MAKNDGLKSKLNTGIGVIYFILLIVFNVLVFTVFKNRNGVFWLSYAFMTAAFIVQICSMLAAFKTATVETAFFGIPLASFSVYYLCAELAVGAIFMIFTQAPLALALIVQLLILAAFVIIAVISLLARDTVVEINDNIRNKVTALKYVLTDVEMLTEGCSDPALKEKLRRLSETVKYSDPMSSEAVEDVERRIFAKINELRVLIEDNQLSEAAEVCRSIELLYLERNKKLALSK